MQSADRDSIRKTIIEYREAFFVAMLNKHYTHGSFVYEMYDRMYSLRIEIGSY